MDNLKTVRVGSFEIRIDNLSEQKIKTKRDLANKYKGYPVDAFWKEIQKHIPKKEKK